MEMQNAGALPRLYIWGTRYVRAMSGWLLRSLGVGRGRTSAMGVSVLYRGLVRETTTYHGGAVVGGGKVHRYLPWRYKGR